MELKPDFENTPQQQQQQQQQQEEGDEKLEKSQQQQKPKQKHAFHVLAVDDSLIDRKLLEKLLRVSSYKVTCVESGDKALEYLGLLDNLENNSTAAAAAAAFTSPHSSQQEGLTVNLIMTDFCMPGMSGYDLLKKVKGSSWKDVPVVIMSSENVPARISMCLEEGAEEFLLKPLQLSDLDKLEPHLLRSLSQNMDNNEFNGGNNENINNESSSNSSNNNNNEINNFKSNNSAFSKRKALVTETQERRPKMKELAVV